MSGLPESPVCVPIYMTQTETETIVQVRFPLGNILPPAADTRNRRHYLELKKDGVGVLQAIDDTPMLVFSVEAAMNGSASIIRDLGGEALLEALTDKAMAYMFDPKQCDPKAWDNLRNRWYSD